MEQEEKKTFEQHWSKEEHLAVMEQQRVQFTEQLRLQTEQSQQERQALQERGERLEKQKKTLEQTLRRERAEAVTAIALLRAGARNLKAVRAMLAEMPESEDMGEVEAAVEKQIGALKDDPQTSFLFAPEQVRFYGFAPAEGRDGLPEERGTATLRDAVRFALTPEML